MQKKVCLAITSNHDKIDRDFMMHLVTLHRPCEFIVSLQGEHIKSASLNNHVTEASNHNCTHIFFMDVDMNFPPWTLSKLLSHELPIVTGLYHLKSTPYSPIMGWISKEGHAINGNGRRWKDDYCPLPRNSLVEIHWCGIGCLLVDMDVFNKIYFPPFRDEWNMEEGKRQKGHDVIFCEEAGKAGYKIFADTSVDVTHIGRFYVNRTWVDTYHRCNMDEELLKSVHECSLESSWWDEKWFQNMMSNTERSQMTSLREMLPRIPPKSSVIDLGCGDGQILRILKQFNQCNVYGMDFSPVSINILRKKDIPGEVVDLREYEANGRRAHTIILSHVLEHMTEDKVNRVVKLVSDMAEEQAFIIVPQEKELWYEHCRTYDENALLAVVSPHFSSVDIIKINRDNQGPTGARCNLMAYCRKTKSAGSDEVNVGITG